MRFIESVELVNFRCFGESDVRFDLSDFNVIVGPNNTGKSAVLQALRRLVSVNVNRHPPMKVRTAAAHLGGGTDLRLERGDVRDRADSTVFRLVLGKDLADSVERTAPWVDGLRDSAQTDISSRWKESTSFDAHVGPGVEVEQLRDTSEARITASLASTKDYQGFILRANHRWWWIGMWLAGWRATGVSPIFMQLPGYHATLHGLLPESFRQVPWFKDGTHIGVAVPLPVQARLPVAALAGHYATVVHDVIVRVPETGAVE